MGIETEIKFEVSPAALQKIAASRSLRPSDGQLAEHQHLVSTYFDTPNHLLKRHGILSAPERKTTTTWNERIPTHVEVLVATDCFTAEVWTPGGLVNL